MKFADDGETSKTSSVASRACLVAPRKVWMSTRNSFEIRTRPWCVLTAFMQLACSAGSSSTARSTPLATGATETPRPPPSSSAPAGGAQPVSATAGSSTTTHPAASIECPSDMIFVEGNYCPEPVQHCLRWLDPPGPYEKFRCAAYTPSTCASPQRQHERFCVDRDEYTPKGDALPAVHQSWSSAKTICESTGKRLCLESEWQFACEGEEMRPYPYGFERDATACNIDRANLGRPNTGLRDLRDASGSHPRCVSPFGVRDMSGNVEEWATLDHPWDPKDRSTMKGAWWLPGRNTCRAATTGHGETYEGSQVGVRCCKDAAAQ
jgi:sulfatase modifying factor 1